MKIKLIKLIKLTALLLHCFTRIGGIFAIFTRKLRVGDAKLFKALPGPGPLGMGSVVNRTKGPIVFK